MPVIALDRLSKSWGSFRALIDLTVEFPGGAMGLLGPNGAGKTTLLKTLLGLTRTNSGRAEVLGLDASKSPLELRRRVGYMPETDSYIPRLSGVRFVAYAGELAGLPRRSAMTRAHEVLHYVGLDEARYRKVEEYSQGMRQRVRLAQALVADPELLFLDEPTSGMDPAGRREMLALVRDLAESHGKHLVLSTHLLPDVEEVCGFAVVLRKGSIAASGPLSELTGSIAGSWEARVAGDVEALVAGLAAREVAAEALGENRVRIRGVDTPRPLFEVALETGVQVRELGPTTESLEDAFLKALDDGEAA
ncbi:MAG: ABC transporter ATP-binding protein [Planctomycetota bacterium]